MKALAIEVKNWTTGERAGDITIEDIKEGNLTVPHIYHQQLDNMPRGDYELRMVNDDRDISHYEGELVLDNGETASGLSEVSDGDDIVNVNGVISLESKEEINTFIRAAFDKRRIGDKEANPPEIE